MIACVCFNKCHTNTKMECIICMSDEPKSYQKLECKHSFHKQCILKWSRRSNTCPVCRRILPSAFGHRDDDAMREITRLIQDMDKGDVCHIIYGEGSRQTFRCVIVKHIHTDRIVAWCLMTYREQEFMLRSIMYISPVLELI